MARTPENGNVTREMTVTQPSKEIESFVDQARRIAFGGFPDDPAEVSRLDPLLRLGRMEEMLAGLQATS